jgi:hypothetical protein
MLDEKEVRLAYSIATSCALPSADRRLRGRAMSTPDDPEKMFEALSTSSDDPAVQSAINAAAAVRWIVTGGDGQRLTTDQLERILFATGLTLPPETRN